MGVFTGGKEDGGVYEGETTMERKRENQEGNRNWELDWGWGL